MERNKQIQLGASAQTMTSLQIAEATGKMHKDVLKAIRTMEPAWVKVNGGKFAPVDWGPQNEVSKGEWGKRLRDREIQKKGCKTNCPRA